jgi:hypothetical protein
MAASADQHADFEPLREGLRRASAVAGFALRMARENAPVPPGIVSDFMEARGAIEREFVRVHLQLSPDLRKRLKELVLKTKGLTPEVMAKGAEPLAERLRGVLNDLMIDGGMSLSLTEEIFDKAEHETSANLTQGVAQVLKKEPEKERARPPERGFSPIIIGALAILVIGAAGIAAWGFGVFDSDPIKPINRSNVASSDGAPPRNAPQNSAPSDGGETSGPFDRAAAGYTRALRAQPLRPSIDPLNPDVDLKQVLTSEWPLLALGLEEMLHTLEPDRLKLSPEETRRRVAQFADSAEASDTAWIGARRKFLDAFLEHVREKLQLATFSDGQQVLLSDVLSAKGGPRLPLLLAYLTLARACNADLVLIAPMGIEYSLLSQRIKAGTATFDGEQIGLRPTPTSEVKVAALLTVLCDKLRPSLTDAHARTAISAIILRSEGTLDARRAREALADLDLAWLAEAPPRDPAPDTRAILAPAAKLLAPAICAALLDPDARGDAGEAARLLDLAFAAKDAASADKALLLLGERAEKGALYKEEPLAYVVAKLSLKRGDKVAAAQWFKRAMVEFPDHWQSALDFANATDDAAKKRPLLEAAYARGCRTPAFLRELAKVEAVAGENVAALAALDEVLTLEIATAGDVKDAALLCLALEKPKWAQERIANSRFAQEPELLRLDLICELAQNGLSDRARELAKTYGKRGTDDPYIESLLQRFGG